MINILVLIACVEAEGVVKTCTPGSTSLSMSASSRVNLYSQHAEEGGERGMREQPDARTAAPCSRLW
jgi:hypothetical protein